MNDNTTSSIERALDWQLLADFTVTSISGGQSPLVDQLTKALQNLAIQPAQVKAILEALTEMLTRPKRSVQEDEHFPLARIHVWSPVASAERDGWGFFVVEKQTGETRLASAEFGRLLELFLYQVRHP